MFIRKKSLYGGNIAVQICESYREHGKVRQRVLRHVGTVNCKDAEILAKLIETSIFIKNELENQKEKSALEIAPNLPFVMSEKLAIQDPQEEETNNDHANDEHHWVDTAKLSEDSRVVEGIHEVFGSVLDKFELQSLLGIRQYNVLRHLIMARVAWPSSKLRASENLLKHFNVDISVDRMYRFMDALEAQESRIQGALFNAFRPLIGEKVEVLFF